MARPADPAADQRPVVVRSGYGCLGCAGLVGVATLWLAVVLRGPAGVLAPALAALATAVGRSQVIRVDQHGVRGRVGWSRFQYAWPAITGVTADARNVWLRTRRGALAFPRAGRQVDGVIRAIQSRLGLLPPAPEPVDLGELAAWLQLPPAGELVVRQPGRMYCSAMVVVAAGLLGAGLALAAAGPLTVRLLVALLSAGLPWAGAVGVEQARPRCNVIRADLTGLTVRRWHRRQVIAWRDVTDVEVVSPTRSWTAALPDAAEEWVVRTTQGDFWFLNLDDGGPELAGALQRVVEGRRAGRLLPGTDATARSLSLTGLGDDDAERGLSVVVER